MKTIAKVLETMLSKPATPSWNTAGPCPQAADRSGGGWGLGCGDAG